MGRRPDLCRNRRRSSRAHIRHTTPWQSRRQRCRIQEFAKGLADAGLGGVVVALAVEFDATGQLKPGLEVFGFGLVEQSPLGVAQVVELGLCTRLPARV